MEKPEHNIIKFILVYIHRYVGMWCLFMGYFTLVVITSFNKVAFSLDTFETFGIAFMILVIGISLFTDKKQEENILRSFGIIRR